MSGVSLAKEVSFGNGPWGGEYRSVVPRNGRKSFVMGWAKDEDVYCMRAVGAA